ncbi:hypothetical protein Fmac_008255 [Flemingia macrophylla]|uniref:Uncharacterized protein n=1 Tax=Flemingia macrophylla TaxID=520843 RepID=A0ABD1MWW9_9FABA
MIYLSLACTKVKELALLFGHHSKLRLLDQEESDIKSLASTLNSLKKLLYLEIRDCKKLQIITDLPQSLEILDARDASSCSSLQNLPELPHCLTTLDVSSCSSLQSLPKLPKCLKTLDVRGCSLLEALPELPPSLEVLYADECESLKNVLLIPSTMVEQLKENKKRVRFTRCFELDEHSLKAVELNAQMNIMKFAHRHLFAQNHDKAIYVYPGSSVPEWFKYKTTNDYIIIDDLSSQVLAFIFCLVIYENSYHTGREELKMTICDGEGESKSKSDTLTIDDFYIYSPNHVYVYVMYHKKCSDFLISKAKDLVRFQIHVAYKRIPKQGHIKGFGVSPLNTWTYDNLVQQMKLRDSLNHFQ